MRNQAYPEGSCDTPVGVIVCKQSLHRDITNRGYIAMLSVNKEWRKRGIGLSLSHPFHIFLTSNKLFFLASALVRSSIEAMREHGAEEVHTPTSFPHLLTCSFLTAHHLTCR
jgi:peptide alpha-N-acetyltransferase